MEMFNRITKKGSQGIGTLIIFIALILVAAVAAGVIIQTGNSLQSKAFSVGSQTQSTLVTFLRVDSVLAEDTSDGQVNATSDNLTLTLRAGTDIGDIKLNDLTIQMLTKDGVQNLQYSGNGSHTISEYGINYVSNGGVPKLDGYLTGGDIISLSYMSIYNMTEKDRITIRFSPRDGQTLGVDFLIPGAMTNTVTQLYP